MRNDRKWIIGKTRLLHQIHYQNYYLGGIINLAYIFILLIYSLRYKEKNHDHKASRILFKGSKKHE